MSSTYEMTIITSITIDFQFLPFQCTLQECGDEHWNVKETGRFKAQYGVPGKTFACHYDPTDLSKVILYRIPMGNMIHAIIWPILCLITGIVLWLGLCMGCWKTESEQHYPSRYRFNDD